jgi:hypothetical protein
MAADASGLRVPVGWAVTVALLAFPLSTSTGLGGCELFGTGGHSRGTTGWRYFGAT